MGISVWQLLIILAIVLLLFGTKRLRSLGGDLGSAIKNFKQSMQQSEHTESSESASESPETDTPDSAKPPENSADR